MRDPECGKYSDCLTAAARADGELDCAGCANRIEGPRDTEFMGYYILIAAIFRKDQYEDMEKEFQAEAEATRRRIEAGAQARGKPLRVEFPP